MSLTIWLARTAFLCFAAWLLLLAALHVLEPEFAPTRRMLSEYAFGDYGYLMQLAFVALAGGFMSLGLALHRSAHTSHAVLSGLFYVSSVMAVMAMVFRSDSTLAGTHSSIIGYVHTASVVTGIVPVALASVLIPAALRDNPRWQVVREFTTWWAIAIFVATAIHFATFWTPVRGVFQRVDTIIATSWLLFLALEVELNVRRYPSSTVAAAVAGAADDDEQPSQPTS